MFIYYAKPMPASYAVREADWIDLEQVLAAPLENETSASFVARDNNQEVLGLLLAAHKIPPDFGYPTIHIGSIAVKDGHHKKGIGTRLLEHFTAYAEQHSEHSSLIVNRSNQAISLYERFGFHVVDVSPDGEALKMLRPDYSNLTL